MVRGVDRGLVFRDDADRARFVDQLRRVASEERVRIYAWALMPNHAHLVVRSGPSGVSRLMARIGTAHARAFNGRHGRIGHLFQDRFKSVLVESDTHLRWLVRYVHRNPIEAGLIADARDLENDPWTGHRDLVGRSPAPIVDVDAVLAWFAPRRRDAVAALRHRMADAPDPETPTAEALADPAVLHRTVEESVAAAARACGIEPELVWSGARTRPASQARALAVRDLHERIGLRPAAIERAMGLAGGAAARALLRARRFVKK
jgi:REP element-mobilizing transposase RayT